MSDILSETAIALSEVKAPSRRGKHVHINTFRRWASRGLFGGTVKLETCRIGGQQFTSEQAVERFYEACTAAAAGSPAPSAPTPRQRRRQIEAAEKSLAAEGL